MEFLSAAQISFDELYLVDLDIIIAVSGYESRSTYLIEKIKTDEEKKLVLAFEEKTDDLSRPVNDSIFKELGFEFHYFSGNDCIETVELLQDVKLPGKDSLNILIDYSCMTKIWYSSIISFLSTEDMPFDEVNVYFGYSRAVYTDPQKPKPLKIAEPIGCVPGFTSGKPIALVMGLGYEKDRAELLQKSLNPEESYVFYADPADDGRFVKKVYINNFRLIDQLHKNKVINYPILDLGKINQLLTDLCLELRFDYRVILAPLGPKPFALCCLILAARYPDIEVWRVGAGKSESLYDRKAQGDPLIYKVTYVKDED